MNIAEAARQVFKQRLDSVLIITIPEGQIQAAGASLT